MQPLKLCTLVVKHAKRKANPQPIPGLQAWPLLAASQQNLLGPMKPLQATRIGASIPLPAIRTSSMHDPLLTTICPAHELSKGAFKPFPAELQPCLASTGRRKPRPAQAEPMGIKRRILPQGKMHCRAPSHLLRQGAPRFEPLPQPLQNLQAQNAPNCYTQRPHGSGKDARPCAGACRRSVPTQLAHSLAAAALRPSGTVRPRASMQCTATSPLRAAASCDSSAQAGAGAQPAARAQGMAAARLGLPRARQRAYWARLRRAMAARRLAPAPRPPREPSERLRLRACAPSRTCGVGLAC